MLVALLGDIVATKSTLEPTSIDASVVSNETPVTATTTALTVTLQVAEILLPSLDVAVITLEPIALPVTVQVNPLGIKVTLLLFADQLIVLLVASEGVIVAVKVWVSPISKDKEVLLLNDIFVILIALASTVTEHVADTLGLSIEEHVIVQVPEVKAFITPLLIETTPEGLAFQDNSVWVVFEGVKV